MRGQVRIVSEVLLFMAGLVMASFVIFTFTNVSSSAGETALKDQLDGVADMLASAILKSTAGVNTTIKVELPAKLSGRQYFVEFGDAITVTDGRIIVKKELFNITKSYSIIAPAGITSSAQYIAVRFDGKNIIIRRY